MNKLIRYTILAIIAGAILAFNMYHADYKLLVAQVGTIALVAMWLVSKPALPKPALQWPVLAFLGVCVLSFLLSPHKLASWQELYKVGTWVVFGIIVGSQLGLRPRSNNTEYSSSEGRMKRGRSREVNSIINVWLICAGIVAIYGILQFFGIDFMKFKLPGGRIVSTFGNATLLAGFLAMTIPVALVKTLERRKAIGHQLLAISLMFVLLVCLVLTKSRGGILAAMVGILTIYILRAKSRGSRLVPSGLARIVLAGIILAGIALLLFPQAQHVAFDVILRKTARVYIWKDAIQMIRIHPIFGTGIGTFSLYFPQVASSGVFEMHPIEWEFVNHAHSEYMEILTEMGMIGLVAFLAVVGSCILRVRRFLTARSNNNGIALGLFAAFVTILVHNIVSVDLRYTSTGMFFWMLAGMLASNRAISYKLQAVSLVKNPHLQKITSGVIIIAAVIAIYFTARPYIYIHQIEEQEFFVKETKDIERKIEAMEEEGQKDADYLFNLGILYAKNQDFQKAKEYFIKTIRLNPEHAGAFNNLGNIAVLEEDIGRARALFHKAVGKEPDNVEYLVNFASACFKVNVMAEAMESVEKALSIDPDNSRALLLRRQMRQ